VDFQEIKKEMVDKVLTDFLSADVYVKENYDKCRPIYEFINTWN
jgi:dynein heavy chain